MPRDWADEMADDLILDAFKHVHRDARELIAAKLRLLKKTGEADGLRNVAASLGVELETQQ